MFTVHMLVSQGFSDLYLQSATKHYEGNCCTRVVVLLPVCPSLPNIPVEVFSAIAVLTVHLHGCWHLQIVCE